jgi:ketosteroid isomerase-like protein
VPNQPPAADAKKTARLRRESFGGAEGDPARSQTEPPVHFWRRLAMKQVLVITGLLCLVLPSERSVAQGSKEKDARRDKLLAARDAWYAAFYEGDIDAMDKVEAKEFVVIGERVMETKEEQLKGIKKAVDDKKWFPRGMTLGTEDLRIRFEGNVAVITGRAWVKAPDQKEPPKERDALTEVWVERDDRWTVLHLHFHEIALSSDQPKK